jgi:sarcosine oxidase subunit alpha
MKRLPPLPGEWIDRTRVHTFEFEGRTHAGFAGDTITSALAASGVMVLGRSFKYHRPRGVLSLANHDANAVVQSGSTPNVRADVTPLVEGMALTAVNTHGGLAADRARLLDWLSPFLPVGFYYKAFHSKAHFPRWERFFRAITGLGTVDPRAPRVRTPKRYDFCDVLVIGAGPSGLAAALAAADAGAKVVLADENARLGGSGGYNRGADPTVAARTASLLAALATHPNASLRAGTMAAGYYADHWVPLVDAERITKMRARAVVVAAGAYEQPAVFRGNDLPGVMLGSAAQRLVYRYAVKPMERAVVVTANSDGYRTALDLAAHGVKVAGLVDLRPTRDTRELTRAVHARNIVVYPAHCVYEAIGRGGVRAVRIAKRGRDGEALPRTLAEVPCDGVVMSVGWAPAANLLYQAGATMRYARDLEQFVPAGLPAGVFACGRVNGVHGFEARLADGERAGLEAARHVGCNVVRPLPAVPPEPHPPSHPYPVFAHPRGKNFVDFDEDLHLRDFENATQEGFDNIELMKRYTTVGMGPSQGKHSNMNAVRILARLRNLPIEEVGTTTARPFFHPVPMSHLAGRGFQAERETPLRSRHDAAGAVWMLASNWRRPEYYAVPGKLRIEAIRDEVLAVRNGVGLIDVGTLGKIEVSGPDAAAFLERVYTARFANLSPGMTRYGLMVDEAGTIIDDGVIARLDTERFYFTTTTSGSATVYRELTRLNTLWRLQCGIVNVTGHIAAVNLAGPKAREVLATLTTLSLTEGAFPYLGVREGAVAGIPARVMRVGFVGELGYEIHVPADRAGALWDALTEAGKRHGIRPFGVEAQRLLRLEKGHPIVSQDTDGLTNPFEAGCAWAVRMDKPFFVGQRSLAILAKRTLRQRLVGFEIDGGGAEKVAECHLAIAAGDIAGRVTSVAWSPTLGKHIGLAMLDPAIAKDGTKFSIKVTDGSLVAARIVPTPFYDAEGRRQRLAEAA